jgi:hypothetical protein
MPFTKTNVTHKQVNGALVEIPEDEKQDWLKFQKMKSKPS